MIISRINNYIYYQRRRFFRMQMNLLAPIKASFFKKKISNSVKPKIFLFGTPEHGNLGDQAIACAEIEFLRDHFKAYDIFELQFHEVKYSLEIIKESITKNDIITLHGGGNLGIEYFDEEELRREIITNFPNNKILVFPQTIYFGNTEKGLRELERTKRIYANHKDLTLIAREEKSYKDMKNSFENNKVILTPDIVIYLNKMNPIEKRSGITFCFRNDVEGILDEEFKHQLINEVSASYKVIRVTDTIVNYSINKSKRNKELSKKWSIFRKSKLVITDRLHGMVFAAITSTPCIVFSNYNHKVKYTYNWIKHLPYIKFVENKEDVFVYINELLELSDKECKYDNSFSMTYYNQIVECINENKRDGSPIMKSMSS